MKDFGDLWWGYLHSSGTIQAKRFTAMWGASDMDEARASPFVEKVFGPIEVPYPNMRREDSPREYVINYIKKQLDNR